eukprot:gene17637-19392_t
MSVKEGRNFNMKLHIPPEASNIFRPADGKISEDKEKEEDIENMKRHQQRISIARDRRIPALTRTLESTFYESFYFLHIAVTTTSVSKTQSCYDNEDFDEKKGRLGLKSVISLINKMKPAPKFIVFCSGLAKLGETCCGKDDHMPGRKHVEETLENLSANIRVIRVPSVEDFKDRKIDCESVEAYKSVCGDDWYSFWVCGVSFLTINSLYYEESMDPSSNIRALRTEQDDWIESELLQQQVFNVHWTVVFQDSVSGDAKRDTEITTHAANTARNEELQLLMKYRQAGVSHVFCRDVGHDAKNKCDDDNGTTSVKIVGHDSSPPNDLSILLVKVTTDNIEHQLITIDNWPEFVDL